MALGSSWPSSPLTTHFQLHVIAMLCLARCLCGHEVQQFIHLVGKADLASPTLFTVWLWRQFCQHCPERQSWHWRTTWGTMLCTSHCSLEAQVCAQHSQHQPRAWNAFSAFACRDQRSVNISVIYLSQLYSISLFSIQNYWGWTHFKNGMPSKTFLTKSCRAI